MSSIAAPNDARLNRIAYAPKNSPVLMPRAMHVARCMPRVSNRMPGATFQAPRATLQVAGHASRCTLHIAGQVSRCRQRVTLHLQATCHVARCRPRVTLHVAGHVPCCTLHRVQHRRRARTASCRANSAHRQHSTHTIAVPRGAEASRRRCPVVHCLAASCTYRNLYVSLTVEHRSLGLGGVCWARLSHPHSQWPKMKTGLRSGYSIVL